MHQFRVFNFYSRPQLQIRKLITKATSYFRIPGYEILNLQTAALDVLFSKSLANLITQFRKLTFDNRAEGDDGDDNDDGDDDNCDKLFLQNT